MYRTLRAGISGIFTPSKTLRYFYPIQPSPVPPALTGISYVQPLLVYTEHSVQESPVFLPSASLPYRSLQPLPGMYRSLCAILYDILEFGPIPGMYRVMGVSIS